MKLIDLWCFGDQSNHPFQMIYQGKPCLPYFSSVVKNVASPSIEIKKLVYIYLLHYAESDPDLALLSVNAIQKSLTDQNPQVRAMALRTMSGLRVPVISQIVSLAIKRGVGDMSPHVRKAAALSIPKCYRLDPNTLPQLLEYLSTLLGDRQYFVVGPAISAFLEVCPDRIDLVHKHYRALVKKLVDMDEWGQLSTIRLLLHYSRQSFPRRTERIVRAKKAGFYDDEQDDAALEDESEEVQILDPDLELFLKACKPLLHSKSSAVIVAVVSCFLYLGTSEHLTDAVGPLIALLRGPKDIYHTALYNIVSVALVSPKLFVPYASHFLLHATDSNHVWRLKLELLTNIFPHSGLHLKSIILSELEHFSHSADIELVQECVRSIGRCAQSDPATSSKCFKVLLNQITSFDNVLVSEVLTVIRHLIQQDPESHKKTVVRLARNLDRTTSPQARATIIWLVGEFAGIDPDNSIAPDVLRILAKGFASESEAAKQQIVLLAAKVYLLYIQSHPPAPAKDITSDEAQNGDAGPLQSPESVFDVNHPIPKVWSYILLLTRYDTSYDLRDRTRLFKSLLANPSSTQLASLLLLAPKPVPFTPSPSETRQDLRLGSSTLVLGPDTVSGYKCLPDWVPAGMEPDPKLRDDANLEPEYVSGAGAKKPAISAAKRLDETVKEQGLQYMVEGKGKSKTLDDWLDESESESEEEGEDEESDGETESEEGSSEEESEEEGARRMLVS
jgi:AP-3 complex subunit beta